MTFASDAVRFTAVLVAESHELNSVVFKKLIHLIPNLVAVRFS